MLMRMWCAVLGVFLDHPFIPVFFLFTAAILLFAYSFVFND
jgi:hypothetical protein